MLTESLRLLKGRLGGRGASLDGPAAGSGPAAVASRPWVLHPFLLGIFPIVSLYAHNVYETSPGETALPLAVALGSTFLAWLVLRVISGDAAKAGLAASLLIVSFFGFKWVDEACGVAYAYFKEFWVYNQGRLNPLVTMILLGFANGAVFFLIFRKMARPVAWNRALNLFTLILVGLPAVTAISARLRESATVRPEAALPTVTAQQSKPDIYFIVLDGYARGDVMKELYGYDNEPFLERLERRGFFVARQSTSAYCQTRLSIASTLNADYLENLIDLGSSDLLPITNLIHHSMVRKSLAAQGYQSISFATGFEPTDVIEPTNLYLGPQGGHPEFSQLLLEMTPLDAWFSEFKQEDRYSTLRDRTEFLFDRLPAIARMKGPTFTFAHVLSPHPPFVFGEHGEDVSPRRILAHGRYASLNPKNFGTPDYVRDAYRKQSVYLTERVERAIDQILAASPEPPVIILQSDHGSWLRYHPDDAEATDVRERFGILNCIYMPGKKAEGLSDAMNAVNTFRVVLHQVIGAELPLLPGRNEFSPFHSPLHFTDVTERVHSPQERERKFKYPESYYSLEQQF